MTGRGRRGEVDNTVAQRLRFRRMQVGKSQGALGNAVGVTFQQIQKYEKGTNRISAGRLQKIADVLGVPVSFFFGPLPGIVPENNAVLEFLNTAYSVRLLTAFSEIPDKSLRLLVLDLVEGIATKTKDRRSR